MFTVIVTMDVVPERRDEFVAGLQANVRSTLSEPGCLRFDVHCRVEDPNRFVLYELYESEKAFFEGHRQAPHYAPWREFAARCVVPGTHVNLYAHPVFPEEPALPEEPDERA